MKMLSLEKNMIRKLKVTHNLASIIKWTCHPSLWVVALMSTTMISCSRSPYAGAAAYDCDGGDRVIVNERLFCVYDELRVSRPTEMMIDGGMIDVGVLPDAPSTNYCPPEVPNAFSYETLILCAEGDVSLPLIEAVVAQWTLEYVQSENSERMTNSTMNISDMNMSSDLGIGVITDEIETDAAQMKRRRTSVAHEHHVGVSFNNSIATFKKT